MYRETFTPTCILTKCQHNREKEVLRANQQKDILRKNRYTDGNKN